MKQAKLEPGSLGIERAQLVGRFPRTTKKKQFVEDVFRFVRTFSVRPDQKHLFYMDIRRLNIISAFFSVNVNITFALTSEPVAAGVDELMEKRFPTSKTRYSVSLRPGQIVFGEQLFFYSFSSRRPIQKNWEPLQRLILANYQDQEARSAEIKSDWEYLRKQQS
jgi:hypothetical protein